MTPLMPTLMLLLLVATTSPVRSVDVEGQYGRLPDSVARIERETGGKVLQVKSIRHGDREIYRMKVLTPDGRIKVMHDDPRRRETAATQDEGERLQEQRGTDR